MSGSEVYYPRVSVLPERAPWPPSVSPTELDTPSPIIKQLLWNLVLGRARARARELASSVCRMMQHDLRAPCRRVKPAKFVVLREAQMPAVLVEVGYLSNPREASRLSRPEYRQAAARAISRGILSHLNRTGGRTRS